jgi:flavin reductase (DIM6/NTAB) family NADH-FMN oxidoreductase RutF
MSDWHQQIEQVFRLIDREIWIVTAAAGPRRGGLVATWVSRASLDPQAPLVVVGLAPNHYTAELALAAGGFALHLVAREQLELVWQFALGSGRDRDKLAGVPVTTGQTGAPILSKCLAWLECRVVTTYDSGDRIFFWADVVGGQRVGAGTPLTETDLIAAASPEQLAALRQDMAADIERQPPLRLKWRQQFEQRPPQ